VQLTNVVGAFFFGYLVDRIGGKPALALSLVIMIGVIVWLYFNDSKAMFYAIGAVAGFAMAGAQSVSRTMVAMFAPPGKSAEFYGFFALAGKTSSFIGPTVFGLLAAWATRQYRAQLADAVLAEQLGHRAALISIVVFLVVGTVLLLFVNEKRARQAATAVVTEDMS